MNRDNSRNGKRSRPEDIEDDDNSNVKIKKENEDDAEDPCISGIFDAIEFKDQLEEELPFEQLAATGSSDMKLLVRLIGTIATEMQRLTEEVRDIKNILEVRLTSPSAITPGQNFTNKYMIDLPLKTLEEFDAFDEKLKTDDEFLNDFGQSLVVLFDRDERLTRTVTIILRRYLSRELAMKFTATKQSATKLVFKETKFCSCMFDILSQLYNKDHRRLPMNEKRFYSTLSSIFPNAKDWDGCRSLRRRPTVPGAREDGDESENEAD
ncbi:uncharacterized protein LOC107047962 isoform X2 [Diachasma alloeum]|uniref:uncharacterized protein LOC107047962 isoform X2 n=1 Tax=Diachasma alloeum TaxID=454923 RepID=UPI0007384FE6|nr:uncharacterized protein LOC107047962 isoform X2 [Diachasma alloeum]